MYLDSVKITFVEKDQLQTVNVNPENLKAFMDVHPDYEFISITPVRTWISLEG